MKKQWIAVTLALFAASGSMLAPKGGAVAYAADADAAKTAAAAVAETPPGGLIRPEEYILPQVEETQIYGGQAADIGMEQEEELQAEIGFKTSAVYDSDWDKYSSYYFYNQMSDSEKRFWDALSSMCLGYLTTKKNAVYSNIGREYYTEAISAGGLTDAQASNVISMFRYSNPQYYFLKNGCYKGYCNGEEVFGLIVYPGFAEGRARSKATAAVKAQAERWQKQIDAVSSQEKKAKLIHDLIIQKVDYNYAIYDFDVSTQEGQRKQFAWENTSYSQTAYSVFCTDLTVCAGYSQAFEMMCNSSGLDAVAVTSMGHEWNKVRINDSWYNVDCTWDDVGGTKIYYDFFARNDNYYDNGPQRLSHAEENLWMGYLPPCTLDSTFSGWQEGRFPTITSVTAAPEIKGKADGTGKIEVTLTSATPGAGIYYTLDGTTPSAASAKSIKYKGRFLVDQYTNIKAVAVCDGYWDSTQASAEITEEKKETEESYRIVYKLNGGANHKQNPTAYQKGTQTIALKNPTKKGHTFQGWYSDPKFKKKVTAIKKGDAGKKTLYAKWEANRYTIKFHGNGATSGKMRDLTNREYAKSYQLSANKFKKKGFVFTGWNTKKNGRGKSYKNRQSVKNLAEKKGGTIILYAQWRKK